MNRASPRRTARVAFFALLAAVLSVLFTREPLAQAKSRPDLNLRADATTVGVGDQLHITMQATTDGAAISNAELSAPRGFASMGSSSSPTSSITIVNGQMSQRKGLNATWTLRADKIGSYDVGPVTIEVPRDRAGTFEPVIVAKGQPRFDGFDEKIISLYGRG